MRPEQDAAHKAAERLHTFLLEDYKLKVGYLTNHLSRMWTRFNFFITLETLVGGAMIAAATTERRLDNPWQVAILGLLISLCWYLVGVQDRYLIAVYRSQIRWNFIELARNIAFDGPADAAQLRDSAPLLLEQSLARYREGKTADDDFPYPYTGGTRSMADIEAGLLQWRSPGFSVTTWPALFPALAFLLWFVVLVFSLANPE